jgi:BirA family biotin operon repressor/biotin-[acetyl-CoA-carboxylase] ligase
MIDGRAPIEVLDEIDSTILEARRRAERGQTGPEWLVARRQTSGRGRRGRPWSSMEGNLLATYLFRTNAPPQQIAFLGFAASVALAETFDAILGAGSASLKWPNDVFIGGAKVAGVMLDTGPTGEANWVALAFGVNLAASPEALDQPTTCLSVHLPPDAPTPDPVEFLGLVRPRLEMWAKRLQAEGFEPLRRAWLQRALGLGEEARVVMGEQTMEGRVTGLSERGELQLETLAGPRLIAAGDVFLSGAA